MAEYITPEQARELLEDTTPGPWTLRKTVDGEDTPIVVAEGVKRHIMTADPADSADRQQANANLVAAAPDLATMIAWGRVEFALARDSDYGWAEYFTQWGGWTVEKSAAWWHPHRDFMERRRDGGTRIVSRLVIDLEEEDE
ncbi:hypothetical protein [Corynebacterium liangguodongii]|uniref:Uncharacterized protein n=1 Tax=Corynebacterium liangguodongii TaxID=2079535 RepID=A0A2S0WGF2_9CORY|nr:hypothetical protein [Corynebacterium liangguodongii]AWB84806.1 hypothetical protein C3E79_10240 [Corynebacterium liangguodongii]PWB99163.1 hypothetical protein DF219_07855 [Corynebacterium liangguodongii]